MMIIKNSVYFFGDATVNIDPSAEDLAEIALLCAHEAKRFNITPKVALLSFSNFGSARHPSIDKIRDALQIIKEKDPKLIVDGEMQGDTAVTPEILDNFYPFSDLAGKGGANVLIFSNLEAGNTAVKLVQRLSGAEAIGPILLGMQKPVHVLQIGAVNEVDVVYMTAVAVVEAQEAK
jgi:malate dehydrogenase (oxaloacetate-decarboxylating)(NADP+)